MKAVIFDLDGTLWNALPEIAGVWNRVLQNFELTRGKHVTETWLSESMGKPIDEFGKRLLPEASPEEIHRIMKACSKAENEYLCMHGATLYPGLEAVLQKLRGGYLVALVSNCQRGYAEAFMEAHGLSASFDDYETAGNTGLGKGENIRLVLQRNGIDTAVYVGDTEGDEAAAREAGLRFIHAAYGFGNARNPDAVVQTPAELPAAVAGLIG